MGDRDKGEPRPAPGQAAATPKTGKKPYAKPAWACEKILETTALACAKRPGQGGVCNAAPSSS